MTDSLTICFARRRDGDYPAKGAGAEALSAAARLHRREGRAGAADDGPFGFGQVDAGGDPRRARLAADGRRIRTARSRGRPPIRLSPRGAPPAQLGRASGMERGFQYVQISVVAVSLKKKKN